jgi:hypothetical protein
MNANVNVLQVLRKSQPIFDQIRVLVLYFPDIMENSNCISTSAQYIILDNKIKCLSLAVFFGNPTNKTVTRTAYMWGLLIANHLDQSL